MMRALLALLALHLVVTSLLLWKVDSKLSSLEDALAGGLRPRRIGYLGTIQSTLDSIQYDVAEIKSELALRGYK